MKFRYLIFLAVVSLLAFSYFQYASGDTPPETRKDFVIAEISVDPGSNDITLPMFFLIEAKGMPDIVLSTKTAGNGRTN